MPSFPFPHDVRMCVLADDRFETAYYIRDRKKYKRVRELGSQPWKDTIEQEVDDDEFWMVVACFEFRRKQRNGLVGMGC